MLPVVAAANSNINNNRPTGNTNNIQHSIPPPPPMHYNNNSGDDGWSASCLRPPPPLRPCLALGTTASNINSSLSCSSGRKPTSYREDAMILDVIEAYCSAVKFRNTVHSGMLFNIF